MSSPELAGKVVIVTGAPIAADDPRITRPGAEQLIAYAAAGLHAQSSAQTHPLIRAGQREHR